MRLGFVCMVISMGICASAADSNVQYPFNSFEVNFFSEGNPAHVKLMYSDAFIQSLPDNVYVSIPVTLLLVLRDCAISRLDLLSHKLNVCQQRDKDGFSERLDNLRYQLDLNSMSRENATSIMETGKQYKGNVATITNKNFMQFIQYVACKFEHVDDKTDIVLHKDLVRMVFSVDGAAAQFLQKYRKQERL